ncbi:putative tyrosine/serine protein phosphatase [Aspergillus heteromorphus CBS 117.55]|uniref:Putative tyrosine/serine protein phosphatase n=1 Tax=Aspergillus heteromorphus CBS 117.55 TaxID=1448321 RepID=A0A317VTC4_9EURO|nr:putative tyrosine/serine protein phosphatase [Aspergillus heteromorphus CBS 117.55]PWY76192.1 putative tyrosine/serine protein phosphatase [Aspergillus heteromorphus CBS 117.55]
MPASHPRQSSVDLDSPDRPFDNIINFRDVGRTINQLVGKRVLKEGLLFRSARLDDASERDKRPTAIFLLPLLLFFSFLLLLLLLPSSNSNISTNNIHLIDLPHVQRALISLTGKAFERTLLWRLDWWNFFKVLALAAVGYRTDAVTIVGQQVMSPRGLIGLGIDTLDSSFGEMRDLFDLFATLPAAAGDSASAATYPVIVHCTQGKDRTGLIIFLLLLIVGTVPVDAMTADYVRSEGELLVEAEERMKEIRVLGLSEDYTKCPGGFTREIHAHLDTRYGGVEGYLAQVGVSAAKLERIRSVLMA